MKALSFISIRYWYSKGY